MKEAFFIFLVLLAVAGLTAYRYRRQIRSALEFYRTIKTIRERAQAPRPEIRNEPASRGPLVNCQKCGTWVPEETAVRLGRTALYCSTKCLENSRV